MNKIYVHVCIKDYMVNDILFTMCMYNVDEVFFYIIILIMSNRYYIKS